MKLLETWLTGREHSGDREYGKPEMFKKAAHDFGIVLRSDARENRVIPEAIVSYFIGLLLADFLSRLTPNVHNGGSLAGKVPIKLRSISSSLISLTFG
jgi:hypothetical protein